MQKDLDGNNVDYKPKVKPELKPYRVVWDLNGQFIVRVWATSERHAIDEAILENGPNEIDRYVEHGKKSFAFVEELDEVDL